MRQTITSEVLVAHSECRRKAFLLLCTTEQGFAPEYTKILEQRKRENQHGYINSLKQQNYDVRPFMRDGLDHGGEFLVDAILRIENLEVTCAILRKVDSHSSLGDYSYEPIAFAGTHGISKEQKLDLLFTGYVLGQIQHKLPMTGRIIGMDGKSHAVNLESSTDTLVRFLEPLQEWSTASASETPSVILNRHCPYCQFQDLCRGKAEQEDNLSLLSGITPKMIRGYEKKGIFTVKQLSYLFKPRKKKKRVKSRITHKPELQALAIRTGKIYLQELPQLSRQPIEVFLDIEGIPDQQMYYLIGLLVCDADQSTHFSFWADNVQEESQIWQQFIQQISQYPNAPIYHYGSYEPRAIDKLASRYVTNVKDLKNRLVNVNTHVYGKVYFPVCSNGLKEIGNFVGATWTSPDASGLQSLVWRYHWEDDKNTRFRELLITYNKEDCQALKSLVDELAKIKQSADKLSEVDFINQPKRESTLAGKEVHSQFESILEFAHANYDKKKIRFRRQEEEKPQTNKTPGPKKGYQGQRKVRPKATTIIQVPQRQFCPTHGNEPLQPTESLSRELIIDLVLTESGIRKTVTEYVGPQGYCPKCHRCYSPSVLDKWGGLRLYGRGYKAFVVYQRVALRMTYGSIAEVMAEQFNERGLEKEISSFMKDVAPHYTETGKIMTENLLKSPFIHVDETPINICGTPQYVWVFTDGKNVVLKLKPTREATIVHELLSDYDGVLVSDFYSGYDSVKCRQQKCWVHLIRDINDDLWSAPFDAEFEAFVLEVRNLIIPIMEAVQEHGLKKQHLCDFKIQVNEFYEKVITGGRHYKSELVLKYQKRFMRYRESLFVFLEQDDIPWHNNTAERALRHIARQQQISMKFHEPVVHDYLLLLGIRQTCRFQGKSFLKFLLSGETDFDQFPSSDCPSPDPML